MTVFRNNKVLDSAVFTWLRIRPCVNGKIIIKYFLKLIRFKKVDFHTIRTQSEISGTSQSFYKFGNSNFISRL